MEINPESGIQFSGLDGKPEIKKKDGIAKYGDLVFSEIMTHNNTIHHISIQIENGPSFIVKSKKIRKVLSFGVLDISGLSEKVLSIFCLHF